MIKASRLFPRLWITVVICLYAGTGAQAGLMDIAGLTDDRQVSADGSMPWIGQPTARVGGGSTLDSAFVMVFQLPALAPGEMISSATLTFNYSALANTPTGNADLYGLGYTADPAVLGTDFYGGVFGGDLTDATALQDDILVLTSPTGAVTTDVTGSTNLAAHLAEQYSLGAIGGDYVKLRLSIDVDDETSYYYYTVSTANSIPPVLSIETSVVPEPATCGLILGFGILGLVLWRRRRGS